MEITQPEVVECDGLYYMRLSDLGIEPMCYLFDGLSYCQFGSDGDAGPLYSDLETAEKYFRSEHGDHAAFMAGQMAKLRAKIVSGNIKFEGE